MVFLPFVQQYYKYVLIFFLNVDGQEQDKITDEQGQGIL